jgi:hypothetical protein
VARVAVRPGRSPNIRPLPPGPVPRRNGLEEAYQRRKGRPLLLLEQGMSPINCPRSMSEAGPSPGPGRWRPVCSA